MNKFEISSQNALLNHIYKQDNIRIIDGMADNKKCIIICSSNDIYFPNTYEEFRSKIICDNFFEGGRISSLLIEYVKRIILIRDIRKNFYVTGISEKYNSIDSVLYMLEELTEGYEVITAGGSAGGYMATIVGSHLNAEYVINAGGQWNLYKYDNILEKYSFLRKGENDIARSKWFDLSVQLLDNKTSVFYMYGALNESDDNQVKCAVNIANIYPIAIKSAEHAACVSTESYLHLLYASQEEILKIYNTNKGKIVDIDILEKQINTLIQLPKGMKVVWKTTNEKKQQAYADILYKWIEKKQNKYTEIRNSNWKTAAIWGKGKYCKLLINELGKQKILVKCIIETQPLNDEFEGIPIISIENLCSDIDIIIVVPYYDNKAIKEKVKKFYGDIKIIGLDEYIELLV